MGIEEDFEKITVSFEDPEGGEIIVYRHCSDCGWFVKTGKVLINRLGEVKLSGWICKKHGEVFPFWHRY